MSNEKNEIEHKITSKKHIARLEKERRQSKILTIGIISILGLIVLLIVYGALSKTVLIAGRTVAVVNDDKITVADFQKRVRYERMTLTQTYESYYASGFAQYLGSYMQEMQDQLDNFIDFGSTVLDKMVNDQLIIQKATELGITVSEAEIDKIIEENFGFYANGTPTVVPTIAYKPTSTLSALQIALTSPTPDAIDLPTEEPVTETVAPEPTAAPGEGSEEVMPTATESLPTATATLEPTATTNPTATVIPPTATPYTREGYDNLYATVVANLDNQAKFTNEDFRNYVRNILFSQKLYDEVTKDVPTEQEMVWARHILVATQEEADAVLASINAGEDFAALAAQYSSDTSNSYNGGDLGWMYKGQMVEEFETTAWSLEIGETSQPVQTSFGFHIIQVLGHETRQLSADELSSAKSTVYQQYLADLNAAATIERKDIWASVVPSEPSIPADYRMPTQ